MTTDTKIDLSPFARAVNHGLDGLTNVSAGAIATCDECLANKLHCSMLTCDACGSPLGGNRYPAHGIVQIRDPADEGGPQTIEGTLLHLDVCEDCLVYLANGDEPANWES